MKPNVHQFFPRAGYVFLFAVATLLAAAFASCEKFEQVSRNMDSLNVGKPVKEEPLPVDELLAGYEVEEEASDHTIPEWIPGEYPRVVVYFGHGYTKDGAETEERGRIVSELAFHFGLAEDGGRIVARTFPPEYINGRRVRLAFLKEELKGMELDALVLLASPERTHYALAELQDSGITYPVISVFPQDDVLGTESGSTLVLDFEFSPSEGAASEVQGLHEELARKYPGDVADVLAAVVRTVRRGRVRDAPALARGIENELSTVVPAITVVQYVEAETGLRAQNHFVLVTGDAPKD